STDYYPPSRFLSEIPEELVRVLGERRSSASRDPQRHRDEVASAAMAAGRSYNNRGGGNLGGGPRPAVTTTGARGAERVGLRIGDDVTHEKFGEGVVLELFGDGDKTEALVNFRGAGEKRLLLAWAPLHKVEH
ncbi:MAG: ATP-dependent DNA helicase PcrA, partial [Acidimicrobiia bacterium]